MLAAQVDKFAFSHMALGYLMKGSGEHFESGQPLTPETLCS